MKIVTLNVHDIEINAIQAVDTMRIMKRSSRKSLLLIINVSLTKH